jgi:hypothetical protein
MADETDDLADVAPEDFVAARDALARRLKAAGRVAEAAEVKQLRKPTVDAWIATQVLRHHDDAVDLLRQASSAVAAAQERAITEGDRDALRDATTKRRDALREVGRAVDQVLARNGRPATHREEVLARIEAGVTAEVASGTFGLRDDLELPARAAKTDSAGAGEAARKAAERRRAEAEAAIATAEARVERARRELEQAESALAAVMERHGGVERDA